jgi:flagellar motor switch protein FliG
MTLTGKQKAAMLLMSLDAATAAELVKGLDDDMVEELAVELLHLDAANLKTTRQSTRVVRQFQRSLEAGETFELNGFLGELLNGTVGKEKAAEIQAQLQDVLCNRDPLLPICSADARTLALVLQKEYPQTIAVVLSQLPEAKRLAVLDFLDGSILVSAVGRMGDCRTMSAEARAAAAEEVCGRLNAVAIARTGAPPPTWSRQSLRKVALIARQFDKQIRDGLLGAIRSKDRRAGELAEELMIIWGDVPYVTDGSLERALSAVDANTIALALHKADEAVVNKIESAVCERAVAAIGEQASLMSAARDEDIDEAREQIVGILRRMNDKGELVFIDKGSDEYDVVG